MTNQAGFVTGGGNPKAIQVEILARFMNPIELEALLVEYEKAKLKLKLQEWQPTTEMTEVVHRLMESEISLEEAAKLIGYKAATRTMLYLSKTETA